MERRLLGDSITTPFSSSNLQSTLINAMCYATALQGPADGNASHSAVALENLRGWLAETEVRIAHARGLWGRGDEAFCIRHGDPRDLPQAPVPWVRTVWNASLLHPCVIRRFLIRWTWQIPSLSIVFASIVVIFFRCLLSISKWIPKT